MKFLKEGLDYEFLDNNEMYATTPVKLLTGVYKDVIVCFGKLKIVETEENGDGVLNFTFQIIAPVNNIEKLKADSDFKNYLGNVLDSVILEANDSEAREGNTKELDDRPRIWQEGSPIS